MADNTQPVTVIARLLDLTERRVRQLADEGVIPRAGRGRYELVGAVRGYVRYLRDRVLKGDVGPADYGLERARLVKARADLAEMEAAQRRGELLPAPEVTAAWTRIVVLMRARLLALPDKIAPLVHEATTIPEARNTLKDAVHEVLAEIATAEIEVTFDAAGSPGAADGGGGGVEDGGAAAGPDGEPVGGHAPEA